MTKVLVAAVLALGVVSSILAEKPADAPGRVIFLNRHGGTYRAGFDSPAANTSPVLSGIRNLAAFSGDEDDWETVLEHLRTMFKHFDVTFVEVEPPPATPYIEAVVGGTPQMAGFDSSVLGVSPLYCSPAVRSIVFVFSQVVPGDNILVAEAVAHELGHAFSLDHEYLCKDPMSYLTGCGEKRFQNRTVACGEFAERACQCGEGAQNSFDTILEAAGRRTGPPQAGAGTSGARSVEAEANEPIGICETPVGSRSANLP